MVVTTRAGLFATVCIALTFSTVTLDAADSQRRDLVEVELTADVHSIAPGRPFWVAVRLDIEDTWHINWVNPGDAGLAPAIAWKLPEGFTAGALEWPYPSRYRLGPLFIFGYGGEVSLLARITPPQDLGTGQSVVLEATIGWLACQAVCVPGESSVALQLPLEDLARPDTAGIHAFDAARARLPASAPEWNLVATHRDDLITIEIRTVRPTTHDPRGVFFFPTEQGVIENAGTQELTNAGSGFELLVPRARGVGAPPRRLTGVLVSANGWGPDGAPAALQVDVELSPR